MLFHSIEFLIFFSLVVPAYFLCPFRFRWVLLLTASYYFYAAWRPEYLLLILASTLVDYGAGRAMERLEERAARRKYLIASLAANLGLLVTFKYFNFFSDSVAALLQSAGFTYLIPHLNILLPVGISFYTFQTLSYSFDVYNGTRRAEHHIGRFALYVAFFPQLVAGPIERSTRLLPQFSQRFDFDYARVRSGLTLMLWGFFKKVVIADRLAIVANFVYENPERCPGLFLVLGTFFFAFQIYCDFSGYSDIAIGAARVMGYDMTKNFDRPYIGTSIGEYWRRWHISLSSWFRDYLYLPLGGNRVTKARWVVNILAVFMLSGLWHGANGTLIVWGTLHGVFYLVGHWSADFRARLHRLTGLDRVPRFHRALQIAITFGLLGVAWVLFRSTTMSEVWYIYTHVAYGWTDLSAYGGALELIRSMDISPRAFALDLALILFLLIAEHFNGKQDMAQWAGERPRWLRWAVYLFLSVSVLNFGVAKEIPFVYFQF